ncbi:hypothetical protein ACJRO7_034585 [Eucalyptus globulus]|uniref:Uncharacterized protein n=1 Tax=Eucalyptus globulus TaxID=34317 RepID=A0ABD3J3Z9_EUCGL
MEDDNGGLWGQLLRRQFLGSVVLNWDAQPGRLPRCWFAVFDYGGLGTRINKGNKLGRLQNRSATPLDSVKIRKGLVGGEHDNADQDSKLVVGIGWRID